MYYGNHAKFIVAIVAYLVLNIKFLIFSGQILNKTTTGRAL